MEHVPEETKIPSQPSVKVNTFSFMDINDLKNFFAASKEYFEGCMHLETQGVILFILNGMQDENAFNSWCLLNCDPKGISLNSY